MGARIAVLVDTYRQKIFNKCFLFVQFLHHVDPHVCLENLFEGRKR